MRYRHGLTFREWLGSSDIIYFEHITRSANVRERSATETMDLLRTLHPDPERECTVDVSRGGREALGGPGRIPGALVRRIGIYCAFLQTCRT